MMQIQLLPDKIVPNSDTT